MSRKEDEDELVAIMGMEGSLGGRDRIIRLWEEYSKEWFASWMVVDKSTLGEFAAWLIRVPLGSCRNAVLCEVADLVERECWNDAHTTTNQRDQAFRTAALVRRQMTSPLDKPRGGETP